MKKKILIVDDEPDFTRLFKLRLESGGYEVYSANDGKKGMELAIALLPDLIIMDVIMPNLDGAAATKQLKNDPKTAGIPIIFLTAIIGEEENTQEKKINVAGKFYTAGLLQNSHF